MQIQKILLPVDYSIPSDNAVQYGCQLAQSMGARVLLFHAYHIPVPTTEMPVILVSPEELESSNRQRLEKYREDLQKQIGTKLPIDLFVTPGFAADEITDLAVEEKADLIVMGISGEGKLAHSLLGSITTAVLKNSSKPLLIVPEEAHEVKFSKIAFACDYKGQVGEVPISFIREIATHFKASVQVIHVGSPTGEILSDHTSSNEVLEEQLKDIPHSLHFPTNTDLQEGLLEFEKASGTDLLVMIAKKHHLLDRLFNISNTRKMAFHTHIPVLALHE